MRVVVLTWYRAGDTGTEAVREAFLGVSERLRGQPGLLSARLLLSQDEPDSLVIVSEWADMAAYKAWETEPAHRDITEPLRPYQDRQRARPFETFRVSARFASMPAPAER
ncbi:antibiotic biosynthesis monooxygenase family protein [Phytohabitans sp. ZYX-F-186]|uniref:Antibiotic biosynthesis monooxygenase family protein n=1 Tax=Phytohabitans maris TaxID=3071409 RepID=A0ABU0ZK21_9ACTN|nr:antibiotic biosynthesis monooxygenase family protein [Phytohabitans sp. ZYX-F-186]MDQ7907407.1 antibiotic biosynthesis monooxygenase family protein [Phytohabitans sp. ZYX-F-186]